jgi:hypothetical protein
MNEDERAKLRSQPPPARDHPDLDLNAAVAVLVAGDTGRRPCTGRRADGLRTAARERQRASLGLSDHRWSSVLVPRRAWQASNDGVDGPLAASKVYRSHANHSVLPSCTSISPMVFSNTLMWSRKNGRFDATLNQRALTLQRAGKSFPIVSLHTLPVNVGAVASTMFCRNGPHIWIGTAYSICGNAKRAATSSRRWSRSLTHSRVMAQA